MKSTLFVSDLDGTLLNNSQALSRFTIDTVNKFTDLGYKFCYATARSNATASIVTDGICKNMPVIVYNGTFILENGSQRILKGNYFSDSDADRITNTLLEHGISPIVYAFIDNKERFSFVPDSINQMTDDFIATRDDPRKRIATASQLLDGDVFHFTCIDESTKLLSAYEELKDYYDCVYHIDIYSNCPWLEIQPNGVSKARAVLDLKEMLGLERIVCFGDGVNDIPMFEIADECYAVKNAHESLKRIATGIIDTNENDGVARWIENRFLA